VGDGALVARPVVAQGRSQGLEGDDLQRPDRGRREQANLPWGLEARALPDPGGGYYEWTGEKGHKRPRFIQSAGNAETLWFAGLASQWQDTLTCTILTRAANDDVMAVHDRMPVILDPAEREAWQGGSDDLMIGADARLRHHRVAPFGIKDDGPELIKAIDV
jgi:putative SOS response-associated peptidase YedK